MKFSNCLTRENYADNSKTKLFSAQASNDFPCSCGFTVITSTATTIATTNINAIIIIPF